MSDPGRWSIALAALLLSCSGAALYRLIEGTRLQAGVATFRP
jgi:hypothetical protein